MAGNQGANRLNNLWHTAMFHTAGVPNTPFYSEFCFDEKLLKARIKKENPYYNEFDPKTWPCIKTHNVNCAVGEEYTGSGPKLPSRIGYSPHVMLKYWETLSGPAKLDRCHGKHSQTLSPLFRDYPLNFEWDGTFKGPHQRNMSEETYATWMASFGNLPTADGYSDSRSTTIKDRNDMLGTARTNDTLQGPGAKVEGDIQAPHAELAKVNNNILKAHAELEKVNNSIREAQVELARVNDSIRDAEEEQEELRSSRT